MKIAHFQHLHNISRCALECTNSSVMTNMSLCMLLSISVIGQYYQTNQQSCFQLVTLHAVLSECYWPVHPNQPDFLDR